MKKFILYALILGVAGAGSVFAQSLVDDNFSSMSNWQTAGGSWKADGALVQGDTAAPIAVVNRQVLQSGVYQVEFSIKYAAGGYKDAAEALKGNYHAGFGIHIGVDKPAPRRAWGNGKSYLLWVNLDTTVPRNSPHYGFRGQVYQSRTNTNMRLMPENNVEIMPVQAAMRALGSVVGASVQVKIIVNTNDGEIRVYDPTVPGYYYYFYLDPALLKGSWLSLRTNKLSAQFDDFKVTKIR